MASTPTSHGGDLDAVDAWLDTLRAEGARPGTVKLKEHYLADLARRVPPLSATATDLVDWFNAHDWAPETRKSARSAVRGFYRWALLSGLITVDPTANLRPVHVPVSKPRPTPELVLEEALANATEPERCMVLLLAYGGLRRAEAATLRVADITERGLRITGKGGRQRVVPIHPRLEHALRERVANLPPDARWLFPSPVRPGWHVTPDYVYRHVTALTKGYSPHALRHRFATQVYRVSHDIRATQELLGHSSVATTQRYVATDEDSMRAAVLGVA